jgi:hypothetical protein
VRPRRLPGLSYANVVSTLALFAALGGTAVAATQLHGSQIKRGTVTGKQVRAGSIPGGDLRRGTVTGRQIDESKLAAVPRSLAASAADRAALADRASFADRAALADRASLADRATAADGAQLAARATSAATADAATSAADSERLGGQPASSYLDRCEAGTRAYAGVCIEAAARPGTTWPNAAEICGDAGGRLPSLDELEGFRQEPGIVLSGGEHTSTYLDVNGIDAGGEFTVGLYDNGGRSPGFAYGSSGGSYRCVKPLSNR